MLSFFLRVCNGAKHPKQFRCSRDIRKGKQALIFVTVHHQFNLNLIYILCYHLRTSILQEPSSGRPIAMMPSPEQVCQELKPIFCGNPPSENPLVTTAPFSHHNRRFRSYSTFTHTRNSYFRETVFYITMDIAFILCSFNVPR